MPRLCLQDEADMRYLTSRCHENCKPTTFDASSVYL